MLDRRQRGELIREIAGAITALGGEARVKDIHRLVSAVVPTAIQNVYHCLGDHPELFQRLWPRGPYRLIVPVPAAPPPVAAPVTTPTRVPARPRRKRGQLQREIEALLVREGSRGLTEIAIALGANAPDIFVCVRKHPDRFFQEKPRGPYSLRSPATGVSSTSPAASAQTNGHVRDYMTERCLPGGDHEWVRRSELFGECLRCHWQKFYLPQAERRERKLPGSGLIVMAKP